MPRRQLAGLFAALLALATSAAAFERSEERRDCAGRDPLRRPFFGDTHVHTGYSQDASTQGTRAKPKDAYAFARGEPLGIQPFDEQGRALRTVQLDRPLDFAVVTDHAEQIGEVHICQTPGAPGHGSWVCRLYRGFPRVAFFLMNYRYSTGGERWGFCGDDDEHCLGAARTVWQDTQEAAEGAYDRSAGCAFTSFVGYEWTSSADRGKNLHRNVIFRNERVPDLPPSVMETGNTASDLWDALERECVRGLPGCEVLAIPHNSNLDGGLMFQSAAVLGAPIGEAEAARRARWEPLIEVMQHKGDSECLLGGDTTDEACGFEKLPYESFGGRFLGASPPSGSQFIRHALKEGLRIERSLGANPFRYGFVASTDTHLGAPGLVAEKGHPGHGGAGDPAGAELPSGLPDNIEFGPGGLAVVWAEENSRDALFEGLLRRETYGTSGPRMVVRMFGGWAYDAALCGRKDFVTAGYAGGVPMGGELSPPTEEGSAPRFAVWALQDPGTETAPGAPLQRIQVVKGWLDAAGSVHEEVFDVAGGPNDASVDLATCRPQGAGARDLCEVWQDPGFDPAEPSFYYARVLLNPTCRWSQHLCLEAGVDCADPATIREGFEDCCSDTHRPVIQERAWTSPIWYGGQEATARLEATGEPAP